MGVKAGIDPKRVDESGWGIIFADDADPAIKEALSELIELRRGQASDAFKLFEGANGYQAGISKTQFLARHGAGPGPADPRKVPYYLLIVGSPQQISFRFQSQMDVQYAVGRINFRNLDDYARYAASVVAAETGQVKLDREAAFFAPANLGDQASHLIASQLAQPLFKQLSSEHTDWEINAYLGDQASKVQLARLLGGDQTPALLFAAGHGLTFANGATRQLQHQGALLCQDWPGPSEWRKSIPADFYFSGDDLQEGANLSGLIAWFYASYSAGTPYLDEFARKAFRAQEQLAPKPFLTQLPRRMLAHPQGGALAIIGLSDESWGYSFLWDGTGRQTDVFESTMRRLLKGHPVGSAVEYFNERYAELSTVLSDELEEIEFGKTYDAHELAGMWSSNNDSRGFIIIGDPAVRLPVTEAGDTPLPRPTLQVILPSTQKEFSSDEEDLLSMGSAAEF